MSDLARCCVLGLLALTTLAPLRSQEKAPVAEPRGPGAAVLESGEDPRDIAIRKRVEAVLREVPPFADIAVAVRAGVVRLKGEAPSADAVGRAVELVTSLDGVLYVYEDVETRLVTSERISPSIDRVVDGARDLVAALPLILIAILVFALFWMLARFVDQRDALFQRLFAKKLMRDLLQQTVKVAILIFGLYCALEIVGATALVSAVLGTAGVVGLAVGFAFRDIVENYLASLILSLRQPFRSKDFVRIADQTGTVIRMTMRESLLMTPEGNHVAIPNAAVFKSVIENFTRNPLRRFVVSLGVGVDVDLREAKRMGVEVLNEMRGVVDEPGPYARVGSFGDSNVELGFYGWVDQTTTDFGKVKSEAARLLKEVMDDHGVDMPEPTYRVHVVGRKPDSLGSTAEKPRNASTLEEVERRRRAQAIDVEIDHTIEDQVEKDLQQSGDEDLLEGEPVDAASDADSPSDSAAG